MLRALAEIGIAYDTSHCPGIARSACRISLRPEDRHVQRHCGTIEVPIGSIAGPGGRLRHYQLTALTARELLDGTRHAAMRGQPVLTLVSHSFELLSRDRTRANALVRRRFTEFCTGVSAMPGVTTATYSGNPPAISDRAVAPLPHSALRTGRRLVEQALANALYGAK